MFGRMSGRYWTAQNVARLGKEIYEREIRDEGETELVEENKALVVDVSTGGYVIADSARDAFAWGRERYPDGVLYLVPVGAGAEEV